MSKPSRPARAKRLPGVVLAAVAAFAVCAAWASESPLPQAAAADVRRIEATLRIDAGDESGKPIRIVHPLGQSFEVDSGNAASTWRATFVARPAADGDIALDGSIRSGDRIVGTPSLVVRPGERFSLAVDGEGSGPGYRIEGVVAFVAR